MDIIKKAIATILVTSMILCALPISAKDNYSHSDHAELALSAVGEGIVLLKNDENALPLKTAENIALFGGGQRFTSSMGSGYQSGGGGSGYQIGGGGSGWVTSMLELPIGPIEALLDAQAKGKVNIYEPLVNAYKSNVDYIPDENMYNAAAEFANTAIMFITRYSTEGSDINIKDWYLTDVEKNMMKSINAKFDKFIVILNAPGPISTEWSLDSNELGVDVDALLATYLAGEKAAEGIAQILTGEVNPSGKLTHTYANDIYSYPSTNTFLENISFVDYEEDIYVGYRYFETFAKDKVTYHFGFGLSYTTFDITPSSPKIENGKISVDVTVKNTGSVAGKEVVQVYYSAPGAGVGSAVLSKSAISLACYAKTKLLAPGESQKLTLTYDAYDMASFDDTGKTGKASRFVLEAGDYDIRVGNSVRSTKSVGKYTVDKLTVVSNHDKLLTTTLDKRLAADGSYEKLPVNSTSSAPAKKYFKVSVDKLTWIEAEDGIVPEGSGIANSESFNSSGYLYDGTKWVQLPGGTVLGNMNGNKSGNMIKYTLKVEKAGVYNVGFVIANGSGQNADNLFNLYISTDSSRGTKQPVSIDVENTSNAGTGSQWFNFKFQTKDKANKAYTVTLPEGTVTLSIYIAKSTDATPNIDKFVLIPEGQSCAISDVLYRYEHETDVESDIDVDADNYKGITYADVASGKNTLEELIAQMSYTELIELCYGHVAGLGDGTGTIGFLSNATAEKYGVYSADTSDGPAGLRLSRDVAIGTFWPCATLQACTWNVELIEKIGVAMGEECIKYNADLWLAPALNIQRNPLCGRNFEYYSEDPVVSGKSAAAIVNGVESTGVGCSIKHFAINHKETNRKNSDSRVSEKAIREIYLKGFKIVIDEADPVSVMTSYNLINGTHTSANSDLIRGILRGEWKYDGVVISDWDTTPTITDEILAGNNVTMPSGEHHQLILSAKTGVLEREVLEENAAYVIKALVKLPDHTVHMTNVNKISGSGKTTITADQYSNKSFESKLEIVQNKICISNLDSLDTNSKKRGFIEFKVSVDTPGTYSLTVEYAATTNAKNAFEIQINGEAVEGLNTNIESTGKWSSFKKLDVGEIFLKKGVSTIRIQHTSTTSAKYLSIATNFVAEHPHVFGEWIPCNDTQHQKLCECNEAIFEDHTWNDGEVTLEPNKDADGEKTFTCSVCSATKKEPIDKLSGDTNAHANAPKILPIVIGVGAAVVAAAGAIVAIFTVKKKKKQ